MLRVCITSVCVSIPPQMFMRRRTNCARSANQLRALGVDVTEPRLYPEYASDYVATFFESPDGIRLEVTNYRHERKERHDQWHRGTSGMDLESSHAQ